jgi:hypothetical protein
MGKGLNINEAACGGNVFIVNFVFKNDSDSQEIFFVRIV